MTGSKKHLEFKRNSRKKKKKKSVPQAKCDIHNHMAGI